jgi:hypothetical protein
MIDQTSYSACSVCNQIYFTEHLAMHSNYRGAYVKPCCVQQVPSQVSDRFVLKQKR